MRMKAKLHKWLDLVAGCLLLLGCNNADNTARPPVPGPGPQTAPAP